MQFIQLNVAILLSCTEPSMSVKT